MHEKIIRDLKPVLDALERKDTASYLEVEKELITLLAKANYRLGQYNFRLKGVGGKVKKGGKGR